MRLALLVLLTSAVFAQAPKRWEFEVASVRPSLPGQGRGAQTPAAAQTYTSQIRLTYLTFRDIVMRAFDVKTYQVVGPDWIGSERYDILATMPEGATAAQLPEMYRRLLEERLGLKVSKTQKEFAVYTLTRGKRPFALKEVQPTDEPEGIKVLPITTGGLSMEMGRGASYTFTQGKFDGKGMSMEMLASMSTQFMTLPVVNQTGLTGFYDFHFDLAPEDYSAMMMTATSKRTTVSPQILAQLESMSPRTYFDALDKVGLHLEKGKAMLDVINIDEASKMPSEN